MDASSRTEPPPVGDELATVVGFLEFHRETLEMKCSGLTDGQLRERSVPPSALSLLGLVMHLTEVERNWFRVCLAAEPTKPYYYSDDDPDGDFDNVDTMDVQEAFAAWRRECARSREVLGTFESLDELARSDGDPVTLRWVLVHMVEEYSRHNGHADLLRERIDGATGE